MNGLKLEVGGLYQTQDGSKVEIKKKDSHPVYPVSGTIDGKGFYYWSDNGEFVVGRGVNSDLDIVAEWQDPAPDPLRNLQKFYNARAEFHRKLYEKFKGTGETISDSGMVASDFYSGKYSAYEHCADEIELHFSQLEKSAT